MTAITCSGWYKEVIHNNKNKFLATELQSGITIRAVSDGSYYPTYQYGTSSWIIKTHNNYCEITWVIVVPGDVKPQFSHCSKLCGLIDVIRYINNICSTYNVLERSTDIECKRLEAYNVATRYAYALSTKLSHYDLSSTIHQLIKASPLSWELRHVKGHQDRGDTYNNIDEWVQMNIEADRPDKDCLWSQIHAGSTHQPHKSISGAIQPTTMEYHNITYNLTSCLSKTIKNNPNIEA